MSQFFFQENSEWQLCDLLRLPIIFNVNPNVTDAASEQETCPLSTLCSKLNAVACVMTQPTSS